MIPFTMLSIIQSISLCFFSMEIQIAIKMDFFLCFGIVFLDVKKIVELKDFFLLFGCENAICNQQRHKRGFDNRIIGI